MGYLDRLEKAYSAETAAPNLSSLDRLKHYNGSGGFMGFVGPAVRNALAGEMKPQDALVLISTNNYGGPISTYKRGVPKSKIDEDTVDAIKRATSIGKKNAKSVYDNGIEQLKKDLTPFLKKLTTENVTSAVNGVDDWSDNTKKDTIEEILGYIKGKNLLNAASTLSVVKLISKDVAAKLRDDSVVLRTLSRYVK
jgi:hypothetical protein